MTRPVERVSFVICRLRAPFNSTRAHLSTRRTRTFQLDARAPFNEAAYNTCEAEAAGLAYQVDEEQTARRSLAAYALRSLGLLGHGGKEAAKLAAVAKVRRRERGGFCSVGRWLGVYVRRRCPLSSRFLGLGFRV